MDVRDDQPPPTQPARRPMREPAHRVSTRAIGMWTVEALTVVLVLLGGQVVWWFIDDRASRTAHWVVGAAWLVLSVAYVIGMPRWRYRVHRWEATEHAIYTQSGWLRQERRIAPLSRVQTIDLERGPVAQLFTLASVTVTTASAAGPLTIHGLDLPVARELVEALTTSAVRERGDAT
ncbi:PH domain-containing protein [Humibacillus xanthopallidus]|nr:PH domain-containing protein [Humibacillus xanthopallidus]